MIREAKRRKRDPFSRVPNEIASMIFDRVGHDDSTMIKARGVSKRWKRLLNSKCSQRECDVSKLLRQALLEKSSGSIDHLLRHRDLSSAVKFELLLASWSSTLVAKTDLTKEQSVVDRLFVVACERGDTQMLSVLLNKGAQVTIDALIGACHCLHETEDDSSLKTLLTYTGKESTESSKWRMLKDITNQCFLEAVRPIKVRGGQWGESSGGTWGPELENSNNEECKRLTSDCAYFSPRNERCALTESGDSAWEKVASSLHKLLCSEELAAKMRGLRLTESFYYLIQQEPRFCRRHNYVQAYSAAIEAEDQRFCERLMRLDPAIPADLPAHFLIHFIRLDWATVLGAALAGRVHEAEHLLVRAVQMNSIKSFRLLYRTTAQYIEKTHTANNQDIHMKRLINLAIGAVLEYRRDKMLTFLILDRRPLKFIEEAQHTKLLKSTVERSMHDSTRLLLSLANSRAFSYELDILVLQSDALARNMLERNAFGQLSFLLRVPYVKLNGNLVLLAAKRVREQPDVDIDAQALKAALLERPDLFAVNLGKE